MRFTTTWEPTLKAMMISGSRKVVSQNEGFPTMVTISCLTINRMLRMANPPGDFGAAR